MERGTVKWFDKIKGYGFIQSKKEKKDYFVHKSDIVDMEGELENNQEVEFEVGQGKKGPIARNVRSVVDAENE